MAARAGSDKVNEIVNATEPPNVYVVNPDWLGESIYRWKRQDETAFPLSTKTGALPVVFGTPNVGTTSGTISLYSFLTNIESSSEVSDEEESDEDSEDFERRVQGLLPKSAHQKRDEMPTEEKAWTKFTKANHGSESSEDSFVCTALPSNFSEA